MMDKKWVQNGLRITLFTISLFLVLDFFLSRNDRKTYDCIDKAVERIKEIRSLPELEYLQTLDGQIVLLNYFYAKSHYLFPQCCLYTKFYYWKSEIREIVSSSQSGVIKHKIKCYHNCISTFCTESYDPRKTHGDVAEFYDQKGRFMGLASYMGDGKYCSFPYDGYEN
jgi:hypothetical protein